jgi:hypothetical protein
LLPQHTKLKEQISEVLDADLIKQQAEKGILDFQVSEKTLFSITSCNPSNFSVFVLFSSSSSSFSSSYSSSSSSSSFSSSSSSPFFSSSSSTSSSPSSSSSSSPSSSSSSPFSSYSVIISVFCGLTAENLQAFSVFLF